VNGPVHRVLERQLRKATAPDGRIDLRALLASIHETYAEHDRDLRRIDRANALMAEELEEMVAIRERAVAAELARQAADAASAAKSRFLANMSHELRTPLNAIIGYGEIIAEETLGAGQETLHNDSHRILGAARHLLQLIGDVLDLTKIESDRLQVEVTTFDLAALLDEVLTTVRPAAEASQVTLSHTSPADIGMVCTDELRIKQCLFNLLSNAIKFAAHGRVDLSARRIAAPDGDMIEIAVADTGIGMTPEELTRAFTPFEQADASITRRFGGTGLGLSIARGLARALGGDVAATSVPGAGSTFFLRFPAELAEAQSPQQAPDRAELAA
jgi:signal transduction histidine kinase